MAWVGGHGFFSLAFSFSISLAMALAASCESALPPALSALEERLSEVFHGSSLDGEQEDRFWEAETAVAERRLRLSAAARKKLGAAARQLSGATTGNESRFAKAVLQSGGHNSALF